MTMVRKTLKSHQSESFTFNHNNRFYMKIIVWDVLPSNRVSVSNQVVIFTPFWSNIEQFITKVFLEHCWPKRHIFGVLHSFWLVEMNEKYWAILRLVLIFVIFDDIKPLGNDSIQLYKAIYSPIMLPKFTCNDNSFKN